MIEIILLTFSTASILLLLIVLWCKITIKKELLELNKVLKKIIGVLDEI